MSGLRRNPEGDVDMKTPINRTWTSPAGGELRLMTLPDRKADYLVLVDSDGMRCLARTLGEREAALLAEWLDAVTGTTS